MENSIPLALDAPPRQQDPTKQAKPSAGAAAASYGSTLRSVQKTSPKPWKKPEQSRATKVYNVNPRDFRDLVQQLTGASSPSGAAAQRSLNSSPHTSAALMHGGTNNGYPSVNSAMHAEPASKDRRAMSRLESPAGFNDIFSTSSSLPGWWQLQSP